MKKDRCNGAEHKKQRRLLLPLAYGRPCPLCGEIMLKGQALDLDHEIPRRLGGGSGPVRMTHARCNRSLGGKAGSRIRWGATRRAASRRW